MQIKMPLQSKYAGTKHVFFAIDGSVMGFLTGFVEGGQQAVSMRPWRLQSRLIQDAGRFISIQSNSCMAVYRQPETLHRRQAWMPFSCLTHFRPSLENKLFLYRRVQLTRTCIAE